MKKNSGNILYPKGKRVFNPNSEKDIQEYKDFRKNMNWKNGCPFQLEHPFISIPAMIDSKIITSLLGPLNG